MAWKRLIVSGQLNDHLSLKRPIEAYAYPDGDDWCLEAPDLGIIVRQPIEDIEELERAFRLQVTLDYMRIIGMNGDAIYEGRSILHIDKITWAEWKEKLSRHVVVKPRISGLNSHERRKKPRKAI